MKKIFFLFLCCMSVVNAAQHINIQSKLSIDSPSAILIFEVKDLSNKSIQAQSFTLTPGNNLAAFDVGDVFQIVGWSVQGPKFVSTPCAVTSVIDHKSLIVTLQGAVGATGLRCSFQEVAALPNMYLSEEKTVAVSPTASADPKMAYQEISKYLTALKKCAPGKFHAKFPDQEVNYSIIGEKADVCDVTIDTGPVNMPLLCHFTKNDILLLTSSYVIDSYEKGNVNTETNKFNTNIMNARCSPGIKK